MTYPKPGLVSHVDRGAHLDMDAPLMLRSVATLRSFFAALASAGEHGHGMYELRVIGVAAEAAMLGATGGVNTHRGAIFGLGLLCAAAGARNAATPASLGSIVANRWAGSIRRGPIPVRSHGTLATARFGALGARGEAAAGFPSIYQVALPALREARAACPDDPQAQRVHALLALMATVDDTNLLHRGGAEGLDYAQARARDFMHCGGIAAPCWRAAAIAMHRDFVARGLSPGGCADLLAMALFVDRFDTC